MQDIDRLTVAGWGLLLMPLLVMWHEIGGHAAACALQGGHVATIGAFYVECEGLYGWPMAVVSGAGVIVNAALALVTYALWLRAKDPTARIVLWLIWQSEAFVASGYFLFSGLSGVGDLGIGADGGLAHLGLNPAFGLAEIVFGLASYIALIWIGIRALGAMIGTGLATRKARRGIAHVYYVSAGIGAVLVGLLNPVGIAITILSAAASTFGGLAGFISIGFMPGRTDAPKPVAIPRSPLVIGLGLGATVLFALILGPSIHFGV